MLWLGGWGIRLWTAERIVQAQPTVEGYAEALRWNPGSDEYHAAIGVSYRDLLEGQDLDAAVRELRKAVELKPLVWTHYVDLAVAQEIKGDFEAAASSFREAVRLNSHNSRVRWQAGNFYLRRHMLAEAVEEFQAGLEAAPDTLTFATDRLNAAGVPLPEIGERLLPPKRTALISFLNLVIKQPESDPESAERLAWQTWQRWERAPAESQFQVRGVFRYLDYLLRSGELEKARRVWEVGCAIRDSKLEIRDWKSEEQAGEVVFNGGVEREALNGGLDWVIPENPEVHYAYDQQTRFQGNTSLRIDFAGRSNLDYRGLRQSVILPAGRLQLSFAAKSENITSDQGVCFEVRSYPDNSLLARSDPILGARPWSRMTVEFKTDRPCAAQLALRRYRSEKVDCLLGGRLWIDDVKILNSRFEIRGSQPRISNLESRISNPKISNPNSPRISVGQIVLRSGDLKVSGYPAAEGTTLFSGDLVMTGSGTAVLALADGRRILLSSGSRARLEVIEGKVSLADCAGQVYDSAQPDAGTANRIVVELAAANTESLRGPVGGAIRPPRRQVTK
jgi:tetratricopeptide (TPR) repeat protein